MAGKACDYHSAALFRVEIPGFTDTRFKKVSGLKAMVQTEKIREGGAMLEEKYPGVASVENVTLERGATSDTSDMEWFKVVADMAAGTGADACDDFKRIVTIVQLNRKQQEIARYTLYGCFPVSIEYGDWDNESEDKIIAKLELAFDYFVRS